MRFAVRKPFGLRPYHNKRRVGRIPAQGLPAGLDQPNSRKDNMALKRRVSFLFPCREPLAVGWGGMGIAEHGLGAARAKAFSPRRVCPLQQQAFELQTPVRPRMGQNKVVPRSFRTFVLGSMGSGRKFFCFFRDNGQQSDRRTPYDRNQTSYQNLSG